MLNIEYIKKNVGIVAIVIILISGIGFGAYQFYLYVDNLQKEVSKIQNDFTEIKNLFGKLAESNTLLQEALNNENQKNKLIAGVVQDLSNNVDVFKKLSELDSELLKKYSKVYFLSDNYVPPDLNYIKEDYIYKSGEKIQLHTDVLPFLYRMLDNAKMADIELFVLSGYRSFGDQLGLKNSYVVRYGAGTANSFSAEQGYSEHQLGATVDFTTKSVGASLKGFDETSEYKWLIDNAYKYGFVLSYPQNNNYYVFEPWHWRFVGKDLARRLKNENIYFYEMPQRDIDEYLIDIFEL